jgi:hypothetical protein
MGPVLGFRGLNGGKWRTSALVVTKGAPAQPQLKFKVGDTERNEDKAVLMKTYNGHQVWRLEWEVEQTAAEQIVDYTIGSNAYRYVVPEMNKPLRMAYGSCCGFSHPKYMKNVEDKNAMWKVLTAQHQTKPYHLMMMGGDQIYADSIWDVAASIKEWYDQSGKKRKAAPFTKTMDAEVEAFYFDTYCRRWSQKEVTAVMSQIPTLMMWDDHDIFDGWGSYPPEQQESKVFQGIYTRAREHFRLFQLQAKDDNDLSQAILPGTPGFTYAYRIGDVAVIALDMRSERTQNQVMSLETWNKIQDWMYTELSEKITPGGTNQPACKHLLVMSGIPVVYVNSNMIESALGWLPGQQDLEDDFKDQWLSLTHQGERLRIIHRLLKFSKDTKCRVTIVSGDVHVAALGYVESTRDRQGDDAANVINQLISSGMVHTPPPGIIVYLMEKVLGDNVEEVDRGITAQMLKFPGTAKRFIAARNWLSLTLDDRHRIWAEWFAEGEQVPYTKVIHSVGAVTS